jgi:hypothetical protein
MRIQPRQTRQTLRSIALVVAVLAILLAAAPGLAQDASPSGPVGPDTPVSSGTMVPGDPGPDDSGATLAEPQDGLTDIRVQGWEHIDVAPDGRTLTVYYWSGVDTCYGLAGVLVRDADGVVTVELQIGTLPGVEVCIDMAQLFKTIVVLDAPVIGGGLS